MRLNREVHQCLPKHYCLHLRKKLLALGALLGRGQLFGREAELLASHQPSRGLRLHRYFLVDGLRVCVTWPPGTGPGCMRVLSRQDWAGDLTMKRTMHTPEEIIRKLKAAEQVPGGHVIYTDF